MLFYATFISGFDTLVRRLLCRDRMNVVRMFDGAVLFETATASPRIPYLNNVFLVLRSQNGTDLQKLVQDVIARPPAPFPLASPHSFRIFVSRESQLVSLPGNLMHNLVDVCSRMVGAPFSSRQAEAEIWFIARSEDISFCLYRLTEVKKHCARGELRPELACLLCEASEPQPDDIVLDPFAGSGAIPLMRSHFPFQTILASEIQADLSEALKRNIRKIPSKRIQRSFFVRCQDFLANSYQSDSFSAIITDPPWGLYERVNESFYPSILAEFGRILHAQGRLVMLTAYPHVDTLLPPSLTIRQSHRLLVSGQKATAYVMLKP